METMTIKPTLDQTNAAISPLASRLALVGAALFVVLLVALHFLKPELDPSWHFISEYASGRFGWVMVLAFLALAVGFVSLFVAIRTQVRTIAGRIGLGLLLVSAAGLTMGAIFVTDPITTSPEAATTTGVLHNLGGTLGIAMPFAAALISWALARNPIWTQARQALLWAAALAVFGFLVAFVSLGVMLSQSNGAFGPDVLVGWPNRFEIITNAAWVMVVAWQASKLTQV